MTDKSANLMERRRRAMGPAYFHFYETPLYLTRGEGVWLFDDDGNKYLDCYNNVPSVGHCHRHVVDALIRQAQTLNTHTRYLHHLIVEYAEMLAATLPGDLSVCMFVCTGTEANDLAYQIARSVTGNDGAIITQSAYHGGSTLVSELSPESERRRPCPDFVVEIEPPDTYRGQFGADHLNLAESYAGLADAAIATLHDRGKAPAMLMIDSIFDGRGLLVPPPNYQRLLYDKVRAAGGLVVADEVQAGLCRLGDHYWGFMDCGVVPDIVTMGKPLGNGHPLAVVATTPAIAEEFARREEYFNTFGGNPVSAAAGKAVLEVIEREGVLNNVKQTGAHLATGLKTLAQRHSIIGDVRGKGLYYGVELVSDRTTKDPATAETSRTIEHMRQAGVVAAKTGKFGNIIKLRPPLVFNKDHADLVIEKLDAALTAV